MCGASEKLNSSRVLTAGKWASLMRRITAPAIAFLDLGFEQRLQITQVRLLLAHRFFGQAGELVGQGRQIELPGVLLNRGLLNRLRCAHWTTSVATGKFATRAPESACGVSVQVGRSCS